MTVPTSIFERAALLPPAKLRSLDAIHLASALALGDELRGFVTYDEVLAESATQSGLRVTSP
jgi:predicted nucleic acid-binding protein